MSCEKNYLNKICIVWNITWSNRHEQNMLMLQSLEFRQWPVYPYLITSFWSHSGCKFLNYNPSPVGPEGANYRVSIPTLVVIHTYPALLYYRLQACPTPSLILILFLISPLHPNVPTFILIPLPFQRGVIPLITCTWLVYHFHFFLLVVFSPLKARQISLTGAIVVDVLRKFICLTHLLDHMLNYC